jgi:hypothetical protein
MLSVLRATQSQWKEDKAAVTAAGASTAVSSAGVAGSQTDETGQPDEAEEGGDVATAPPLSSTTGTAGVGSGWEEGYYTLLSLEKALHFLPLQVADLMGCTIAHGVAPAAPEVEGVHSEEDASEDEEGDGKEGGKEGTHEKVSTPSQLEDEHAGEPLSSAALFEPVMALLLHPHVWLRLASARLLGLYFSQRVPAALQPRLSQEFLEKVPA